MTNRIKNISKLFSTTITISTLSLPTMMLLVISFVFIPSVDAAPDKYYYAYFTKWGAQGSGNGEFDIPQGIDVDSSTHEVYVADTGNDRIQKFKLDGMDVILVTQWGSGGQKIGQFNLLNDVAVDSSTHYVYALDAFNYRVQKFSSNGAFITQWGSKGSGNGQFSVSDGIAVDSSTHEVYVVDTFNNRVQKFSSTGSFITKWGSKGSANGQFLHPEDVAVDSSTHEVYVTDNANNRVQKFSSTGSFITKWGSKGSANGQFFGPGGIAVDPSSHNVFVTDGEGTLKKFSSTGSFITKWGSKGSANGQFFVPEDVAVDSSGHKVFVADTHNYRIQVFILKVLNPPLTTNTPVLR